MNRNNAFESLPVELIADILSELDLSSLVTVSYLSHRLHAVSSEPSLNPWRRPILRTLRNPISVGEYDPCLKHLSVRASVPRQNFVEILSIAHARFLLFEASLPNLKESEWEECFRRRFLPSWTKVKQNGTWKEAFLKVLYRVWHRTSTSCTTDEAWTKYLVLNRNGTVNQLEGTSRGYNPLTHFEQLRIQNDLLHLQPSIRVLIEFADVRVLAIGVLHKPRRSFGVNTNARSLLHPPGIENNDIAGPASPDAPSSDSESEHMTESPYSARPRKAGLGEMYRRLMHPLPVPAYADYPFYTPGGGDTRWIGAGELEEGGMQWVGSMMITAQLLSSHTEEPFTELPPMQDADLVDGPGTRNQYASLTFADLVAIAPWVETTKQIEGPGLGHDE